jgi:hypothetical protein
LEPFVFFVHFPGKRKNNFYVASFGNSIDRLLRRTLHRSEQCCAFLNRVDTENTQRDTKNFFVNLRVIVPLWFVSCSAELPDVQVCDATGVAGSTTA